MRAISIRASAGSLTARSHTPAGVAITANAEIVKALRSLAPMIRLRPTSPIMSPSQFATTTASRGGIARPSTGTSKIAMPNPASPRTNAAASVAASATASCSGVRPASKSAQVRRGRFRLEHCQRLSERHHPLALLAKRADCNRAFLGLALADHQQVRDLLQRVLAHLVVDLLVAQVGLDADARGLELRLDVARVVVR